MEALRGLVSNYQEQYPIKPKPSRFDGIYPVPPKLPPRPDGINRIDYSRGHQTKEEYDKSVNDFYLRQLKGAIKEGDEKISK